ncbi:TolB family protein [Planococcus sp. 107-1]|uniref:TolB family protein n=1 Tax=Planococcus sp. 107-1 TaxID=2908840 RepID=UPI0037C5349A
MAKKAVEIKDLTKLISVTDPHISPDGTQAVFIRTHMDEEENTYIAHLYHSDLASGGVTQWTHGKERVSSPSWSADGSKIAFLSTRDEKNQLYVIPASGGEAKALTDFEKGVNSFVWSPCNKKIWINAMAKDGKTFTDKEDKEEKKKPEPVFVTTMKYKMDGAVLCRKMSIAISGSSTSRQKKWSKLQKAITITAWKRYRMTAAVWFIALSVRKMWITFSKSLCIYTKWKPKKKP